MTYLDSAATALIDKKSLQVAYNEYLLEPFNPSALYQKAQAIAKKIQIQKASFATILNCHHKQLYYTSGATESNNIVISSFLHHKGGTILISPMEHASVYNPVMALKQFGFTIKELPVTKEAKIDFNAITDYFSEDLIGIFCLFVCNENGAILDIERLGSIIEDENKKRKRKIHFHCDCVQALGKLPIDLNRIKPDSASFCGHKIGAIRGSGLLYLKRPLKPIYDGGGQEDGIRSGTQNIGAMSSFLYSLENATKNIDKNKKEIMALKSHLLKGIKDIDLDNQVTLLPVNDSNILLDETRFSPYIVQLAIVPLPSEVIVRLFDDNDIALSGGSACASSQRTKALRVSNALKYHTNVANSTIRISFGFYSTIDDVNHFLSVLKEKVLPLAKKF